MAINVKETASEFFRRYSDLIVEAEQVKEASGSGAEDEEDPDVTKADKVKGKDGKTQKDAEKKLPPWLKGGDKASKGKAK